MESYIKLAEILAKKFGEVVMCQIIGGANEEKINELLVEYGI